jgi:hypothetical protein
MLSIDNLASQQAELAKDNVNVLPFSRELGTQTRASVPPLMHLIKLADFIRQQQYTHVLPRPCYPVTRLAEILYTPSFVQPF